ncbi:MAG: hypothetical protein KAI47_07070, partial [Deltaproteobacteria bacterium]|nr:hypothetical protein [Deltaproteobacteria bacterium]
MADKKKEDPFGSFDEGGWDDAIEEWGQSLEIEMPVEPSVAPPPSEEAAADDNVDPIMHLIGEGDIELDEGQSAALGSLLGAEPSPTDMSAGAVAAKESKTPKSSTDAAMSAFSADSDLDIDPEMVAPADAEIEVSHSGWDTDRTPIS